MSKHVVKEISRCLQCASPNCIKACPVNTNIPEIIKLLLDGKIDVAGEKLFLNNPLSSICSLLCPHEEQCEGACTLRIRQNPIQISYIENYVSEYFLTKSSFKKKPSLNRRVAIIGSGTFGITISILLALKGYQITLFESKHKIGGSLKYGIPELKLPKDTLYNLQKILINLGVKIRPNTSIGDVITLDDLTRDGYDAIFIGTGGWNPNKLSIKGETLAHVHYGIDYLKNPSSYNLGNILCIIGAGNIAINAARIALRNNVKKVYIMYRQGLEDITATKSDLEYAKIDGVEFEFFKAPLEILDEGLFYVQTKKIVINDGSQRLQAMDNTKSFFAADSIIIAIGQKPQNNNISNNRGLKFDKFGSLIVDENGKTTRDGVFASGNMVMYTKTVVECVNLSKKIASAIDAYITKKYEK